VGVLARAAFLVLEPPVERMGDEPSWLSLAVHGLAERKHPLHPLSNQLLFYPPLYPYFLAVPYVLTGGHTAAQWIQVVVGALLIPAVGLIGARCFSPRTGLLAAAFVALYPDLVWFAAHFWSETLFVTLLCSGIERSLAAAEEGGLGSAVGAGVLLGLSTLTRETALLVVLLASAWLAWPGRSGERTGGWKRGAALLIAALLTIAPWTWRNWVVFRAFIPISTYGALNLWLGNTDLDRDEVYRLSDSVEGPVAQYHFARGRAVAEIARRQPWWIFEKTFREVPALFAPWSEALVFIEGGAYGMVSAPARALARAAIILPWVALLLLGSTALALFEATRPRGLLLLFLGGYVLLHIAAFGHHRFHLPLVPVLAVLAAAPLCEPSAGRRVLLH
jgi:asparagine N-glycosylation enzyme membrane subunit Stt3